MLQGLQETNSFLCYKGLQETNGFLCYKGYRKPTVSYATRATGNQQFPMLQVPLICGFYYKICFRILLIGNNVPSVYPTRILYKPPVRYPLRRPPRQAHPTTIHSAGPARSNLHQFLQRLCARLHALRVGQL